MHQSFEPTATNAISFKFKKSGISNLMLSVIMSELII